MFGAEATRLPMDLAVVRQTGWTPTTDDVGRVEVPVEGAYLLGHEADDGRVGHQPVAVVLASLAVAFLVDLVSPLAVVEHAFLCRLAGEDSEVVHPPLHLGVEAGASGIVDQLLWAI